MKKRNKAEIYNSPAIDEIFNAISPEQIKRTERKMLLAARIDDAIKSKGWKKSEFADRMGKKPSEISKWLSGTNNFTADTLWDIEDVLGIQLISIEENREVITKYQVVTVAVTLKENGIGEMYPDARINPQGLNQKRSKKVYSEYFS